MTQTEHIDVKDTINLCTAIYIFNIVCMLMQFHLWTIAPGMVGLLCIFTYANIKQRETKGTIFESHFRWIVRTFWIGSFYYMILAIAKSAYFLMNSDLSMVMDAVREGETNKLYFLELAYEKNADLALKSYFFVLGSFTLWWAWRALRGVYFIRKGAELPKVTSWI
jgi:uncharacterized membrane protein